MIVSFFDPQTGLFSGRTFRGSLADIEKNTPPGLKAMPGRHDHLSVRVVSSVAEDGTESLQIIDYQPPRPSVDHEWSDQTKRWAKKPEVVAAEMRSLSAKRDICNIELTSLRSIREYILTGSQQAKQKLEEFDTQITEVRKNI